MTKESWEKLPEGMFRYIVPGGWLYRYGHRHDQFPCMVFVPDVKSAQVQDLNEPPESWTGYCERE